MYDGADCKYLNIWNLLYNKKEAQQNDQTGSGRLWGISEILG